MNQNFKPGELIPVESLSGDFTRGRRKWKSVEEFEGRFTTGQTEGEKFPGGELTMGENDRRRFLSLMAGSLALAGLAGCTKQPTEQIYPYVSQPENLIPGKPKFYATAVSVQGYAEGVLVESHEGRPTKVEGNPQHPMSLGATGVLSQACLMDLYDPDRAKQIKHLGMAVSPDTLTLAVTKALVPFRDRKGAGLYFLAETVTSPTLNAQIDAVSRIFPAAKWHFFEPASAHSARTGSQMAFGRILNTFYRFDAADVILAIDSDFLATGPGATRYARDYARRRRRGDRLDMNRLYAAECEMTSTGGKADHRIPLRPSEVGGFVHDLAAALGVEGASSNNAGKQASWIRVVANDLLAHRGRSVVIAGDSQDASVHALTHAINTKLGNIGTTVLYSEPAEFRPTDQIASLKSLVDELQAGRVELLFILGGNPVYNAPTDFRFADALKKAKLAIRLGLHEDETSALCHWHVPESHSLEDWGDIRAIDGTVSIQQPLISPLYDSYTAVRLLDLVVQSPGRSSYEIVRSYWQTARPDGFEGFWRKALHDGVVPGTALPPVTPALKAATFPAHKNTAEPGTLDVAFRPDVYLHDGRFANNIWLQELPRPMSKLTWDNAIHLSPRTARRLRVEAQQQVELQYRDQKVRGAVWISPGHPDDSATVHLGFGREISGRAGSGAGFSAYRLRHSDALNHASGITLTAVGDSYPLATTQMQQYMEGRDLVIAADVGTYRNDPEFARKKAKMPEKNETLYPQWTYNGYSWGMSIDLTACVNCNACVIACQAENNIPVVGKQQVLARRAMHWLRVDAYYEGNLENPKAYYQPVPCMQCENAPCELVCPVQATNHSSDGLNDMIYNRCVGTRYCSNNCPYKVRRFNFLLYADWKTETWKLQRNPDVSVRSRGVMEKCTYCVQRIREAEIEARRKDGYIADGAAQTACQQVCPTEAIIFGDINNPNNRVAKQKAEKLDYALLAELNTRPRTTYLAELRNPNREIEETRS